MFNTRAGNAARRQGFAGTAYEVFRGLSRNPTFRQNAMQLAQQAGEWGSRTVRNTLRNRQSTARNNLRGRAVQRGVPLRYISAGKYNRSSGGGRGRKGRGRKRRFRGKRRKGGVMNTLMRHITTPVVYKSTNAAAAAGTQNLRAFTSIELGGEAFLKILAVKKPSNFLYNTTLGTSSTATVQDPTGSNYQLCIDSLVHDMRIQNRSNASMELQVYECLIRRDADSTAITTASAVGIGMFQHATDIGTYIGSALNNLGPGQAALPTGMTHNWQNPTFKPYDSNEFCQFFKILKKTNVIMSPNEIKPMRFAQRKFRIRGTRLESAACVEFLRGWSKVILFSWVGMPVDDGTLANQGKAKCDLYYQDDVTCRYHFTPGSQKMVNFAYSDTWNGVGSLYSFNPSGFTAVVPASDTIETVPGYTSTLGTTVATDTAAQFAP